MLNKTRHWHAIYTKSRAEKKVQQAMIDAGFEVYLPLQKVSRKWSDRIKTIEVPLIPSYIFVHVNEAEYYNVLSITGAVAYVTFEGKAAKIPVEQLDMIRLSIENKMPIEAHQGRLRPGQKVKVVAGPFVGKEGTVTTEANKTAFVINLPSIGSFFTVTINAKDIVELDASK